MDEVRDKLQRRLGIQEPMLGIMVDIIESNGVSLNIRNLASGNLILFDKKKRRIGFSYVENFDESYWLRTLNTDWDVAVVVYKDTLLGWVKVSDLDGMVAHKSLINAMPSDFDFSIECIHLPENGGYTLDYKKWICFGCGKELVFSDKKR